MNDSQWPKLSCEYLNVFRAIILTRLVVAMVFCHVIFAVSFWHLRLNVPNLHLSIDRNWLGPCTQWRLSVQSLQQYWFDQMMHLPDLNLVVDVDHHWSCPTREYLSVAVWTFQELALLSLSIHRDLGRVLAVAVSVQRSRPHSLSAPSWRASSPWSPLRIFWVLSSSVSQHMNFTGTMNMPDPWLRPFDIGSPALLLLRSSTPLQCLSLRSRYLAASALASARSVFFVTLHDHHQLLPVDTG